MDPVISLTNLLEKPIGIPISYGFSNDFGTILDTVLSAKVLEGKKVICILAQCVLRCNNDSKALRRDSGIQPGILEIVGSIVNGKLDNNFVVIFATSDILEKNMGPISAILKAYYDKATHIIQNNITEGNLISSTEDVGRAMGISEVKTKKNEDMPPRVLIVSNSANLPNTLSGMCYNMGCIDNTNTSRKDPVNSGLNRCEQEYMTDILKLVDSSRKKWATISRVRKSIFSGNNVIKDIEYPESPDNIGGYEKVKDRFTKLGSYLKNEKSEILRIKGSLFIGPAGTGKSKIITAVPRMLGLPGFELDINAALGAFQGQSETKLKDAIERAKKLAPCVLCLDEIEKMLSGVGEGEVAGNEVATKLFGIILTAMAEPNNIYWAASANKVSHLPAPLLRKGRFDDLWYVPLPGNESRAKILGIHCRLNSIPVDNINVNSVVEATKDFTGAEIMHAVKESYIEVVAKGLDPTATNTSAILEHVHKIKPISTIKKKEIEELEQWAKDNAILVE